MEFRMPDIGEGVAEGEIVRWIAKAGDAIAEDQPLVEVMTDKATVTIPCPVTGKIEKLLAKEGQVVAVGAPIVVFTNVSSGQVAQHGHGHAAHKAAAGDGNGRGAPATAATALAEQPADRVLATPATRRRARELGVDIRRVRPTGEGGRVTREDVERAAAPAPAGGARAERGGPAIAVPGKDFPRVPTIQLEPDLVREVREELRVAEAPAGKAPGGGAPRVAPAARAPSAAPARPRAPEGAPSNYEERVPLRGIRRKIAEHLVKAKHTAPHFTYVEEVDATELVALKDQAKPIAEQRGVRITYLPFIIKSVVAALREFPALNASLDDAASEIVYKRYYNIGFAADTEAGLIVPVIKNADRLSILDIARELDRLSQAARTGMLEVDELQGGTFTITSVGALGGLLATPILNYPEVAILGVHKIARRPVVRGDRIEIGHVMLLSLSLDHRVVDGATAARFMNVVVKYLQDPKLLLLEGI